MDYKKYSLEKLEEWMHDAISCSEATPQEIYHTIKKVVDENHQVYKSHTERCYELLCLMNGNGIGHISAYDDYLQSGSDVPYYFSTDDNISFCDTDDSSPYCKGSWNDFWDCGNDEVKEDKVVKWQLPVNVDGLTGECYVNFPDDLLQAANLKEGDTVEWIDRNDGSFELRKVNGTK